MLKQLGNALWTRVVLSYKQTLTGIGIGAAILILDAFTGWFTQAHPALAPALATISGLVGAFLRSKQQAALAAAQKELSSPPVAGFVRLGLLASLLCLLVLVLSAPRLVRADEAAPGTACFATSKVGQLCFAPDVAGGLIEVNLKTGQTTSSIDPLLGFGVCLWSEKPYAACLNGHLAFRPGAASTDTRMLFAGGASLFKYVRIEVGKPFKGDNQARLFIGLGSTLKLP